VLPVFCWSHQQSMLWYFSKFAVFSKIYIHICPEVIVKFVKISEEKVISHYNLCITCKLFLELWIILLFLKWWPFSYGWISGNILAAALLSGLMLIVGFFNFCDNVWFHNMETNLHNTPLYWECFYKWLLRYPDLNCSSLMKLVYYCYLDNQLQKIRSPVCMSLV
jgi:hypothetical protein